MKDHHLSQLLNEFKISTHKIFIETGTHLGNGIISALQIRHFEKIYSIELSEKYFNFCKNKFQNLQEVNIILGDSGVILGQILDSINSPCVFWLDGHFSAGDTACSDDYCSPIVKELEHIKNHKIKNHTIIIDDMLDFTEKYINENWRVNKKCGYILREELEKKILEINPDYRIIDKGKQLVAIV